MDSSQDQTHVSDNPINDSREDRLHRKTYADALGKFLSAKRGKESLVVAIQGPWGSGKSSLANLIVESVGQEAIILRFNPWMFSGAEQLVSQFFIEVSSQVLHNNESLLQTIAKLLTDYGDYFASIIGKIPNPTWFEVGFKAWKFYITQRSRRPAAQIRDELIAEFGKLEKRVIIFIDDLDRMREDEVREIVRLVRLVGNFPNITYVLTYDRERVARALDNNPEEGGAFLEKIVQIAYEVPKPRQSDIDAMVFSELHKCINMEDCLPLDEKEWGNIWFTVIQPLIKTPRDIKRYVITLPALFYSLGKEISLVDLLAIEGIRILLPDTFKLLPDMKDVLTNPYNPRMTTEEKDAGRSKILDLIDSAKERGGAIREACERLFPATRAYLGNIIFSEGHVQKWERERRIASPAVLSLYLHHALEEGAVTTFEVEKALSLMPDRQLFYEYLQTLNRDNFENLLERLESYEGLYPPESIVNSILAILDLFDRFREEKKGMYEFGGTTKAMRVVYRLLKQVESPEDRGVVIHEVCSHLKWLSAQYELIRAAKGHEFIDDIQMSKLIEAMCNQILVSDADVLKKERDIWWLCLEIIERFPDYKANIEVKLDNDEVFIQILRSALSETHRHAITDAVSTTTLVLPWERLEGVFGKDKLITRVLSLPNPEEIEGLSPRAALAIGVAKKYAAGWRPDDFFGRKKSSNEEDDDEPEFGLEPED